MTTIQILKQLIVLEEKKEKLQTQVAAVTAQIDEARSKVLNGVAASSKKGKPAKPAKPAKVGKAAADAGSRGKRGQLGEDVIAALQGAGSEGLGIKELAARTGKPEASLRVWLATTGKKTKGLKKVSRGVYAFPG